MNICSACLLPGFLSGWYWRLILRYAFLITESSEPGGMLRMAKGSNCAISASPETSDIRYRKTTHRTAVVTHRKTNHAFSTRSFASFLEIASSLAFSAAVRTLPSSASPAGFAYAFSR